MKQGLLYITLVLFIPARISFSQNDFKFEHIGYGTGLPEIFHPRCIVQDHFGFLWIAEMSKIIRYDGFRFKIYHAAKIDSTYLTAYPIRSLFVDSKNNLWAATSNGLSLYQRENDTFINFKMISEHDEYTSYHSIREDANGVLWFTTNFNGLISFDRNSGKVVRYLHDENIPGSIVTDSLRGMETDDMNNIYISTFNNGVIKFDISLKKFTNYFHSDSDSNSIGSDITGKLYNDKTGNLWIGLDSNRFDKFEVKQEIFKHYQLNFEAQFSSFYKDKSGLLWIAPKNTMHGITIFDESRSQFFQLDKDVNDPQSMGLYTTAIAEDRSGLIWVAAVNQGLYKFNPSKQIFRHYKNELNKSRITMIIGDKFNNLWIGTDDGLDKLELATGQFTHFTITDEKFNHKAENNVISLFIDNEDFLWIVSKAGLSKFDIKNQKLKYFNRNPVGYEAIPENGMLYFYKDSFGDSWVGTTRSSVYKVDNDLNVLKHYQYDDADTTSYIPPNISYIFEDRDRTLWLASGGWGITKYDRSKDKFTSFFDKNTIRNISFACDADSGALWLSSFHLGLTHFDHSRDVVQRYNMDSGLISNCIYKIIKDDSGYLWLSSKFGLMKFDPKNKSIKTFEKDDGLDVSGFYKASYKSNDGTLYFGSEDGIISFHPDKITSNQHAPDIVFTDFKINGQSVAPGKDSPLEKNISVAEKINLNYWNKSLSLEFIALDYSNPSKNSYAFMMEGFDKDWTYSGNVRTAHYTNLDAGEYTFRVRGTNNDGLWNEKGVSIRINVSPPWWNSWWFRGCAAILIFGGLFFLRQRKLTRITNEMKRKEDFTRQLIDSQEQERKRIAGELHDSLGQNLLVIKNKLLMKMQKERSKDLQEIEILATAAVEEVRSISHNLRPYELDRLGLTVAIESIIDNVKDSTGININFECANVDNLFTKENETNFYRIVQECMSNILKHSDARNVIVKISKTDDSIQVFITDDGKGFDVEEIRKRKGGMGLLGIEERVKILGGKLQIQSVQGMGTDINIRFQINSVKGRVNSNDQF